MLSNVSWFGLARPTRGKKKLKSDLLIFKMSLLKPRKNTGTTSGGRKKNRKYCLNFVCLNQNKDSQEIVWPEEIELMLH